MHEKGQARVAEVPERRRVPVAERPDDHFHAGPAAQRRVSVEQAPHDRHGRPCQYQPRLALLRVSPGAERALDQGRQRGASFHQVGELVDDDEPVAYDAEQPLERLVPVGERIPAAAGVARRD